MPVRAGPKYSFRGVGAVRGAQNRARGPIGVIVERARRLRMQSVSGWLVAGWRRLALSFWMPFASPFRVPQNRRTRRLGNCRRLQLECVCVKRPIRNAADALEIAFRGFYCTINVFSASDVDRLLEAFESMAIGTKQSFEKTNSISAHVRALP